MTNDISAIVTSMIVVGILAVVMRWVFRPSRPRTGRPVDAAQSAELGMLDVVATDIVRERAMQLRATLGDAGIRSSMSRRRNGNHDVLVFHDDVAVARALLGSG